MNSHDPNDSSANTIQDLIKILPKHEQTLQVRMQDNPSTAASSSSSTHKTQKHLNNHRTSNSNSPNNIPCYHTLRYDFKPASVNSDEPAKLELTKDGQVTIRAPNVGGSICTFKGQRRPHMKECLLIVDNKTGEVVLQKLTDNITVKATRTNGGLSGNGTAGGCGSSNGNTISNNGSNTVNGVNNNNSNSLIITTSASTGNHQTPHAAPSSSSLMAANINDKIPTSDAIISNTRVDGPQLSEESSDSNSSDGSSSDSSNSSSESSSSNSSPNHEGFTF